MVCFGLKIGSAKGGFPEDTESSPRAKYNSVQSATDWFK